MSLKLNSFCINLFILIVPFLLINSCGSKISQRNDSDLKKMGINGNVKYLKQYAMYAEDKFGEIKEIENSYNDDFVLEFNKLGFLTKKISYDDSVGDVIQVEKYIYLNSFNIKYELFSGDESSKNLKYSINNEYDTTRNVLVKRSVYNTLGYLDNETFFYSNENNNDTLIKYCNSFGKVDSYKRIFYENDNKNIISEYVFSGDHKTIHKVNYEHSEQFTVINKMDFINNKSYQSRIYYNKDARVIKEEQIFRGVVQITNNYKYDLMGNQIEISIFNSESLPISRIVRSFADNSDLVIKETVYNIYNKIVSDLELQYKFDDSNNWIKKIIYDRVTNSVSVVNREIEYY